MKRKGSGSATPGEADPSEQMMAFPPAFRDAEMFALHLVCKAHPRTCLFSVR